MFLINICYTLAENLRYNIYFNLQVDGCLNKMPPRAGKKYYHGNEKQILTKHEEALGKDTKQHNNNTLFHEPRHGIYEINYAPK